MSSVGECFSYSTIGMFVLALVAGTIGSIYGIGEGVANSLTKAHIFLCFIIAV